MKTILKHLYLENNICPVVEGRSRVGDAFVRVTEIPGAFVISHDSYLRHPEENFSLNQLHNRHFFEILTQPALH